MRTARQVGQSQEEVSPVPMSMEGVVWGEGGVRQEELLARWAELPDLQGEDIIPSGL